MRQVLQALDRFPAEPIDEDQGHHQREQADDDDHNEEVAHVRLEIGVMFCQGIIFDLEEGRQLGAQLIHDLLALTRFHVGQSCLEVLVSAQGDYPVHLRHLGLDQGEHSLQVPLGAWYFGGLAQSIKQDRHALQGRQVRLQVGGVACHDEPALAGLGVAQGRQQCIATDDDFVVV